MSSSLYVNRSKPNFDKESLCLRSQILTTKSLSYALPSKSASWGLFLDAVIASNVPDALSVSISKGPANDLVVLSPRILALRPLTHFLVLIWPCKNGKTAFSQDLALRLSNSFGSPSRQSAPSNNRGLCWTRIFCCHASSLSPMFSLEFDLSEKREN